MKSILFVAFRMAETNNSRQKNVEASWRRRFYLFFQIIKKEKVFGRKRRQRIRFDLRQVEVSAEEVWGEREIGRRE